MLIIRESMMMLIIRESMMMLLSIWTLATENGRNWKVISTPKEVPKCNLLKANGKDGFPLFKVNKDDKADQFRPWIGGDKDNTDRILGHADRILGYISLSIEHLEQYVSDGNKANPNTKTNPNLGGNQEHHGSVENLIGEFLKDREVEDKERKDINILSAGDYFQLQFSM